MTLAWVYRGPLAGRDFLLMEEDELERAEQDGWAQRVEGVGSGMFPSEELHPVESGPHAAAEAFAARRQRGERGYPTREMVAEPLPPAPPAVNDDEPKDEDEPKAKQPKPAEKPKPKKQ